ncbi:MAG: helix-turn-helix transcriptional regulator, partial [Chitinivibrionales bacterium]|nr:helix-turn-helix transcriptional regulator [Chitinivibrionales bacterium]
IINGPAGIFLEKLIRDLSHFFKTADDTDVGIADLVRVRRIGFAVLEEIIGRSKLRKESYDLLLGLQKLKPAIDYINNHTHEAIALDALAALLDLSPYQFKKTFFTIMHKRPLQYIRHVRIQKAQHLLSSGDLSVKEISDQTGYRTIFYFSRDFKNATGKSPLEYRRNCRTAGLHFRTPN